MDLKERIAVALQAKLATSTNGTQNLDIETARELALVVMTELNDTMIALSNLQFPPINSINTWQKIEPKGRYQLLFSVNPLDNIFWKFADGHIMRASRMTMEGLNPEYWASLRPEEEGAL